MNRHDDINVCDECFCVSHKSQQKCPHCGYVFREFVTTSEHYREIWVEMFNIKNSPVFRFTITDHLRDCFGFLCYKRNDRFDEFVDAFHKALVKDMPWLKGMGV